MAVASFDDVQEALEAIQTQLAELLAMINARPTRNEMSDAVSDMNTTVGTLRTQVQTLNTTVESLSRSVNSLGETLESHSH